MDKNPDDNRVVLRGRLIERDALRYTPGGVPIMKFRLAHESTQLEAGGARKVDCEIGVVAFDTEARLLSGAALGTAVRVSGFLDRKTRQGRQLVLHASGIEFLSEEQS